MQAKQFKQQRSQRWFWKRKLVWECQDRIHKKATCLQRGPKCDGGAQLRLCLTCDGNKALPPSWAPWAVGSPHSSRAQSPTGSQLFPRLPKPLNCAGFPVFLTAGLGTAAARGCDLKPSRLIGPMCQGPAGWPLGTVSWGANRELPLLRFYCAELKNKLLGLHHPQSWDTHTSVQGNPTGRAASHPRSPAAASSVPGAHTCS